MRAYTLDPNPLPRCYQIYSVLLALIKVGEFSEGETLPAARRLVAEFIAQRPTALFMINTFIAGELVRDLLTLEAETQPEALAGLELATFNTAQTEYPYPCVTAVHPVAQLGRAATKLLLERLEESLRGAVQHQIVPMTTAPKAAALKLKARVQQVA